MADLICEHMRIADTCEECNLRRSLERGQRLPEPSVAPRKAEVAKESVYIERTDLDTDSYVLVNKGDPIPAGLEKMPRRPVKVPVDAGAGVPKAKGK